MQLTIQHAADFWKEVHKTDDCWYFNHNQIKYKGHLISPHRLAWELTNGKLTSKFVLVLHSCGNDSCVNPTHLYEGTSKDVNSRNNSPEKFWKRVDKNGPVVYKKLGRCWQWTGGVYNPDKDGVGYGQVQYKKKSYGAHRLSWLLTHGELPEKLCVLHKCDNMLCVRPSHLFTGSPKQNTADMIDKGRRASLGKYERTPDIRAKIGASRKGKRMSQETKLKIRNKLKGIPRTPEVRAKISATRRLRNKSKP